MKLRMYGGIWAILFFVAIIASHVQAAALRIGTWKTAQTIQPFFYADFLPDDQQVKVFSFTNPADQKTALLAGSLDMCGTTITHAIFSASRGQPVVVVAALCNKCSALVVRTDGPVHRVSDLRGLKLGYVPGTMHEILLRETLAREGLVPGRDVRLVRVDFFDMGTSLARGDIDAFLSGEPFPTMAAVQGFGRILAYPYYPDTVGTINAGMLVTRTAVEKNPQRIAALILAHAKATLYLQTHRDQWLQRASAFGAPRDVLDRAAANMELAWEMDDAFVARCRALGERMQALGVIDRQPDYQALFDLTFVQNARQHLSP